MRQYAKPMIIAILAYVLAVTQGLLCSTGQLSLIFLSWGFALASGVLLGYLCYRAGREA